MKMVDLMRISGEGLSMEAVILQMQADLLGLKSEEKAYEKETLGKELKQLESTVNPKMPHQEYEELQKKINSLKQKISELEDQIEKEDPNLKIARLPDKERLRLYDKKLLFKVVCFLPGIGLGGLASYIFAVGGEAFGLLGIVPLLIGIIALYAAAMQFENFSRLLYLNPAKYFQLEDPSAIVKLPVKLNQLSHDWLTKIGLRRIEQAIERLGQLAGQWDNKAAELKALRQQAEKESNQEAMQKIQWHQNHLETMIAKLRSRLQTLQISRDQLISLQTYDLKLVEIEAEINGLGKEVEGFLFQTTQLLKQIRETVDLALTAEVQQIIEQGHDVEFDQLEKLIRAQARAVASLPA